MLFLWNNDLLRYTNQGQTNIFCMTCDVHNSRIFTTNKLVAVTYHDVYIDIRTLHSYP